MDVTLVPDVTCVAGQRGPRGLLAEAWGGQVR